MNSSIRRKIMLLLSLTSFLSSAVFLVYSVKVFERDKIAYIYDSNNVYLETIANQFKNELKLSSEIARNFLYEYQKNKSFRSGGKDNLEEDSFLKGIYLVDVTQSPQLLDKVTIQSEIGFKITENKDFIKNLNILRSESKVMFLKSDFVFIAEIVYDSNEKIALITQFKSDALKSFFDSNKAFQSFLINLKGEVLRQTDDLIPGYLAQNFPQIGQKIETVKMGTSEVNSKKDEVWLLSSSILGVNDNYLMTLTNKAEAFSVLTYLINKSIIVFLMVLSGVVLVSQIASKYMTQRILELYLAAKQIIAGNFKVNVDVKGHDEISLLSQTFNKMAVEIVKLLDETANKARLESELKTAQAVQQTLFPQSYHKFECGEIQGAYQSASECGGDWWHYFENDKTVWFWIADATGHGAPAALITSAIKSAVAMVENLKMEPKVAIELVNKSICQVSKNKMMMTCFLGVFDKNTKLLHYVNASHEAPLVLANRKDLKKKDLVFLDESKCNRLGQSIASEYQVATYQLQPQDRIFVYTDGVPDIRNKKEESLQERGMFKVVLENHNKSQNISEFVEGIQKQLDIFREDTELIDDVTYFALDFK
ncbi:MAG: SpoIIE family protein phosphatase [Pseudobdellovibrio sp.]